MIILVIVVAVVMLVLVMIVCGSSGEKVTCFGASPRNCNHGDVNRIGLHRYEERAVHPNLFPDVR